MARSRNKNTELDPSPDNANSPSSSMISSSTASPGIERVHLAFLGVAVAGCLLWTLWLLIFTVDPKGTINRIMNTESYDEGSFWLLIDPAPSLVLFGVAGLVLVAGGYVFILFKMLRVRKQVPIRVFPSSRTGSVSIARRVSAIKATLEDSVVHAADDPTRSYVVKSMAKLTTAMLVETDSPTRKKANVAMKLVDLVVQMVMLYLILETGYPIELIVVFTAIISLNSIASAVMILRRPRGQREVAETIMETFFDFLIAIGFPVFVVSYCLSTFDFDRAKLAINLEVFPNGRPERLAHVIADPVQMDVIDKSLNSLRIRTVLDFFTRVGTNLALCHRFTRLLRLVYQRQPPQNTKPSSLYPTRHPVGLLFALIPLFVCTFVYMSSTTAASACSSHPECAVFARRWTWIRDGDSAHCPCLTMIAGDEAPKTFEEWINPRNMTEKVGQLAATGDLQTIQLTNRRLQVFPEELRHCKNLKYLSLFYTNTETFPEWIREFTKLEYLVVEGKFRVSGLLSLPDDMFKNMNSLTSIILGVHPLLPRLPSFRGLKSLQSLTLGMLFSVEELPDFTDLQNLRFLALPLMVSIKSMPNLAPLAKLESFVASTRAYMCCNGFLDNVCDLSNSFCQPFPLSQGFAPASCLSINRTNHIATEATRNIFARFSNSVCKVYPEIPGMIDDPVTPEFVSKCNGMLYRQCEMPGNRTGMCYNTRRMPISCNSNILYIAMRKKQIRDSVGDPCDPTIEAWLGCQH